MATKEGCDDKIKRPRLIKTNSISDLVLNNIGTSSALYPREALVAVSGFNEQLHARQEWDLNLRLAAAGHMFIFSDILIYKQRDHAAEHRISNRILVAERELEALKKIYAGLPKEKPEPFNEVWAAYLWGVGRQFIYRGDVDSASILFKEAQSFSPRGFEKHLGWKYRLARILLGDSLPDLISSKLRRSN